MDRTDNIEFNPTSDLSRQNSWIFRCSGTVKGAELAWSPPDLFIVKTRTGAGSEKLYLNEAVVFLEQLRNQRSIETHGNKKSMDGATITNCWK